MRAGFRATGGPLQPQVLAEARPGPAWNWAVLTVASAARGLPRLQGEELRHHHWWDPLWDKGHRLTSGT